MVSKELYTCALLEGLRPITQSMNWGGVYQKFGLQGFEKKWKEWDQVAKKVMKISEEKRFSEPLESVFPRIKLKYESLATFPGQYMPSTWDMEASFIFSSEDPVSKNDLKKGLRELSSKLEKELELIIKTFSGQDLSLVNKVLYQLLKKYGSRIWCRIPDRKDVSHFDHYRIMAAWTACQISSGDSVNQDFILVKGDFSRIQKFIFGGFDLSQIGEGRKLAKKLRGRSAYVDILSDFVCGELLHRLGLPEANLLYKGAGTFLFIIPKHLGTVVTDLEREFNLEMASMLGLNLSLVTASFHCSDSVFSDGAIPLKKVSQMLDYNQYSRHKSYLSEYFEVKQRREFLEDERIGGRAVRTQNILKIRCQKLPENLKDKDIVASFPRFQTYYLMFNEVKYQGAIAAFIKKYSKEIEAFELLGGNSMELPPMMEEVLRETDQISWSTSLNGNYAPFEWKTFKDNIREWAPMEFEKLATLDVSKEEKGVLAYPLLGIMRLDIDNLGAIFGFGLGSDVPLARLVTLSREIELFFNGWINRLAEQYQIYVVYSGGDDGFVVGSWINVFHFATQLRKDFRRLACGNSNFGLSAGIYTCPVFYPVGKFADKAGASEKRAKSFLKDGESSPGKDKIEVFDQVLEWDEFEGMLQFAIKLESITAKKAEDKGDDKLARSMIQEIYRVIRKSLGPDDKIKPELMYRNAALIHNLLARHGFSKPEIQNKKALLLKEIVQRFLQEFRSKDSLALMQIPTRYVLQKTRQPQNK